MRAAFVLAAAFAVVGCAQSGPPRIPIERINRALANAPGEAQPGQIVATESAYARMAREEGQWTAARAFAAPGAQIHGVNGPVPAEAVFQVVPEPSVKWSVRNVWMSCDATVAVSFGRFVDSEGIVGSYTTVWERQPDREYRWVYDLAMPDDPQPPPPEPDQPLDENAIVVTGIDAIEGKVADCTKAGQPLPPSTPEVIANSSRYASATSQDKTLRYRWEQREDGARIFTARYLRDGVWQTIAQFPPQRRVER